MSFCPTCGRQRTGARYCGGCGRDFGAAPAVTAPPAPRPGPARPGRQPPAGRRRALWSLAAVVVVLAVGAGTFLLIRHTSGRQAAPSAGPATTPAGNTSVSPAQPVTSPTASARLSLSPAPSPSVSPDVVSTSPQVGTMPASVEAVLSRYFQGINDHDYAEYATAETADGLRRQPKGSFDKGYATTVDSGMTLMSLTPTGQGDLTATVSFTSHQSPADSTYHAGCIEWVLNLYLVPDGDGYLIAPAPPTYEPTHAVC